MISTSRRSSKTFSIRKMLNNMAFRECLKCGRNDFEGDKVHLNFLVIKVDKRIKENKGKEDKEIFLCDEHYEEFKKELAEG